MLDGNDKQLKELFLGIVALLPTYGLPSVSKKMYS